MFRMIPSHKYVLTWELRTARGVKGMKAKERITLILAVNASGSKKVPVSIIGHAEKPPCFRVRQCLLNYQAQRISLAENKRFSGWYYNHFLPHVRSVTREKVLLLMDN